VTPLDRIAAEFKKSSWQDRPQTKIGRESLTVSSSARVNLPKKLS
jgi:hypothetical protein